MNLLTDPWIPVRCASGRTRMIAPLGLLDDDAPMELVAIRPDFNGALAQFLVGLMQWLAPDNERVWREVAEGARLPELEQWRELTGCFEFDKGERRFMQDSALKTGGGDTDGGDLSGLLLEAPGGNTIRNNADLFVKRTDGFALSLPLAAQALLTLQINAPAGGQGNRTSIRGGGPVSMMLWPGRLGDQAVPLWRKLWLNTLVIEGDEPRPEIIFPWMTDCLTSENGRDVHSLLASKDPSSLELLLLCYFATPRRIWLQFEENCVCAFTGNRGPCATRYEARNLGANYRSELFRHPLSPYYRDKAGSFLPFHVREVGFTYADWVLVQEESDRSRKPLVLNTTRLGTAVRQQLPQDSIWAFAFAMDNMKCLAWHEANFTQLRIEDDAQLNAVLNEVRLWLDAADKVRQALGKQLRAAWGGGGSGETTVAERQLYARTEADFYALVNELAAARSVCEEEAVALCQGLRLRWQRKLASVALSLFMVHAECGDVAEKDIQAVKRAALAHQGLLKVIHSDLSKTLGIGYGDAAGTRMYVASGKGSVA